MTPMERFNYLRNDIYHIWLKSPRLTIGETITEMRVKGLIARPQQGLIECLQEMKQDFDKIPKVAKDAFDDLEKEDVPIGANPFMDSHDRKR